MADSIPQSDVSRPSALPTASLLQSRTSTAARLAQSQAQNSTQYLDDIEEEWNKKVDAEIETLVDGMVDIVSLASIRDKDKFQMAQEAFRTQCRAESMIKASHSLLSITHSMKLLLLLSDESQIASRRDAELKAVQAEKQATIEKAAHLLDQLLGRSSATTADDAMEM